MQASESSCFAVVRLPALHWSQVGRCLSKAVVEGKRLAPNCRSLVMVAAPKDARLYLQVCLEAAGGARNSPQVL